MKQHSPEYRQHKFLFCSSGKMIKAKSQGQSAHHHVYNSSTKAPKTSLSNGAQVAIIIAAVIAAMLLITFCYYGIQGRSFVHAA
jgi:hypothetical protein